MGNELAIQKKLKDDRIVEMLKQRWAGDKHQKDAFIGALVNMVKTSPQIAKCDPTSILVAAANCAQLGLLPISGLDHAYFVPYGDKVQLIIGYKGFVELARRTGNVKAVNVDLIYENDAFEYENGLNPLLVHVPYWLRKPPQEERGEMIGAYVVIEFDSGARQCFVASAAELEKRRNFSPASKSSYSPWKKWPDEMYKKTAIKMASKLWPLSVVVAKALELDNDAELGRIQRADISDMMPSATLADADDEPEEPEEQPETPANDMGTIL